MAHAPVETAHGAVVEHRLEEWWFVRSTSVTARRERSRRMLVPHAGKPLSAACAAEREPFAPRVEANH
jgi:hypothetical protein